MDAPRTFHLHMISDATGETLVAVAKAVRVQYSQVRAIEHIHPLVRSKRELERVLKDVEATPGIVLYTIVNQELVEHVEQTCKRLNIPCVPVLKSILQVFESYLGTPSIPTVAGQHVLDQVLTQVPGLLGQFPPRRDRIMLRRPCHRQRPGRGVNEDLVHLRQPGLAEFLAEVVPDDVVHRDRGAAWCRGQQGQVS